MDSLQQAGRGGPKQVAADTSLPRGRYMLCQLLIGPFKEFCLSNILKSIHFKAHVVHVCASFLHSWVASAIPASVGVVFLLQGPIPDNLFYLLILHSDLETPTAIRNRGNNTLLLPAEEGHCMGCKGSIGGR